MELIFEVRDAEEGGFYARALGYSIFTEADTWEELRANLQEATSLHFDEESVRPRLLRHKGPPSHAITIPMHSPLKLGTPHGLITIESIAELL